LVTDGITDARHDEAGRPMFFGTSGVVKAVRNATGRWSEACQSILESAIRHANNQLTDDATVLVSSRSSRSTWIQRCLLSDGQRIGVAVTPRQREVQILP
jgi:serine/threonine protein phosphatase PrpC